MIKILLSGCCGRMGRVITQMAAEDPDVSICAGVDVAGKCTGDYPVFDSFAAVNVNADVIVDFSMPAAFDSMLDYALENGTPAVVCTTGLSDEQTDRLGRASEKIAVLHSANMSLGINLLLKLVKEAALTLAGEGYDIEIVERHHNQKKDAPSGTALALADSINEALGNTYSYIYDRTGRLQARDPKEIGISAVRGGSIPGTHQVIFAGQDEVIEFNHIAYSRNIFGKGALSAAKYLARKNPGFYNMSDVIEDS